MASTSNWFVCDARDAALMDDAMDATYLVTPEGRRIREADVTPDIALEALDACEDRHVIALALRVALRTIGSDATTSVDE
jgi:hypothetical protein